MDLLKTKGIKKAFGRVGEIIAGIFDIWTSRDWYKRAEGGDG